MLLKFIVVTRDKVSTLEDRDAYALSQCTDEAFITNLCMKTRARSISVLGKGSINSVNANQKKNIRSFTKSALSGADDCVSNFTLIKRLWIIRITAAS